MALIKSCQIENFPEQVLLDSPLDQQSFFIAFGYAIIQQYIRLSEQIQAIQLLERVNRIADKANNMLPDGLQEHFRLVRQQIYIITSTQNSKSQRLGQIDDLLNQNGQEFGIFMQYIIAECLKGKQVCTDIMQTGSFSPNDLNLVLQNLADCFGVNTQVIFTETGQRDLLFPRQSEGQQIMIILLYSDNQYSIPQHAKMIEIDQRIDSTIPNIGYPFICTTSQALNCLTQKASDIQIRQIPGLQNHAIQPIVDSPSWYQNVQIQVPYIFQQPQHNALIDILEEFAKIAHSPSTADVDRLEQALNQIQQNDPSVQQAAQQLIQIVRSQQDNSPQFQPLPQQVGPQNQVVCEIHSMQLDYITSNCKQTHCAGCIFDDISYATGYNYDMMQLMQIELQCNHNVPLPPRDAARIYKQFTGSTLHKQA